MCEERLQSAWREKSEPKIAGSKERETNGSRSSAIVYTPIFDSAPASRNGLSCCNQSTLSRRTQGRVSESSGRTPHHQVRGNEVVGSLATLFSNEFFQCREGRYGELRARK